MGTIRAVFFDLDGTLVDGGVTWRTAVTETVHVILEGCPEIDPDALENAYYEVASQAWESVKTASPPAWGSMEAKAVVCEVWTKTLQRVDRGSEEIAAQAVTAYYTALRRLGAPPYDDAPDCLTCLCGIYRLGIITNGNVAIQQSKMDSAHLSQYFESTTTPDIGSGKPHCKIFEYAAGTMGVQLAESVYVGDSLEWDVGGANGAGMLSVWLNRRGVTRKSSDPIPDVEIYSLAELPPFLGQVRDAEQ